MGGPEEELIHEDRELVRQIESGAVWVLPGFRLLVREMALKIFGTFFMVGGYSSAEQHLADLRNASFLFLRNFFQLCF